MRRDGNPPMPTPKPTSQFGDSRVRGLGLLFIIDGFWPKIGGAEVLVRELARALITRGWVVTVVAGDTSRSRPAFERHADIAIHRFPLWQAFETHDLDRLAEIVGEVSAIKRQVRPDLVVGIGPGPALFLHLRTAKVAPAPFIFSAHGALQVGGEGDRRLVRKALEGSDAVTAVSKALLDDLCALDPAIRDRSTVIYNGLPDAGRPVQPLSTEPPHLLCIGRLVRAKGFDIAISAVSEVHRRFPAARLSVAGGGPARPELEEQVRQAGLQDAVDFLGVVPPAEIAALIAGASLVLVPSRWREPFSLVALQAAQEGRPVVATRRGGLPEVVIDGETGLVVDADDATALAAATVRLLEDPDLARKLGERGRVSAGERFAFDRFVRANHELYCRVVAKNGGHKSG
jgi:glycogen(starch) synthase